MLNCFVIFVLCCFAFSLFFECFRVLFGDNQRRKDKVQKSVRGVFILQVKNLLYQDLIIQNIECVQVGKVCKCVSDLDVKEQRQIIKKENVVFKYICKICLA